MNPHAEQPIAPTYMLHSLWGSRQLVAQMAKREVASRYKGATMGIAWSFLTPLLMLAVYTFVFSTVFNARWGAGPAESKSQFALILFVGMIVHGLFAEVVNRAPALVTSNVNYVKKVVFPLEVLPLVAICSALFHVVVSLVVLMAAFAVFNGFVNWTALFLPLVLLPLLVVTLGVAWFLAALGVYVRDISQVSLLLSTVMLFLSPVFYPVSALPVQFRAMIMANPLTFIIEQARAVLIYGQLPDLAGLMRYTLLASVVAWLGFVWFQKVRKGFADVL